MWGKRTREKQTVPQQFLNTCDYFQHKTQGMYVHIIGWCKIEMWEICTEFLERIYCTEWNLLYMKPSKDNMQEKSEYESLYDSAGNEGYMVCILVVVNLFFFYWQWVLSTNNFLFLLITPVNSGSTKVNIKG